MAEISKLKGNLLDINHKLYSTLKDNPPSWWQVVKNDKELYIEIRKENIIDIYYRGGRVAEVKYNRSTKSIIVKAHPKYLGHDNEDDKDNSSFYKKRMQEGKIVYEPIYQECTDWLTKERLKDLKANIEKYYSGKESGEKTSEKFIQGELIINNRQKYFDSEFAHRFHDGERNTIRIDLVKVVENRIVFEELKRINDDRLRTNTGQNPEIITQMENYRAFLKVNESALTDYYRTLYRIKKDLGLPVPPVDDVDKLQIESEPVLIIKDTYVKRSANRDKRIEDIKKVLGKIQITPVFL